MAETEVRPVRVCDVCGGVDDHPRHVHAAGPDELGPPSSEIVDRVVDNALSLGVPVGPLLEDLYERTLQLRHMDCCRALGCPSGDCNNVPDVRGTALLAAIQKGSN